MSTRAVVAQAVALLAFLVAALLAPVVVVATSPPMPTWALLLVAAWWLSLAWRLVPSIYTGTRLLLPVLRGER